MSWLGVSFEVSHQHAPPTLFTPAAPRAHQQPLFYKCVIEK